MFIVDEKLEAYCVAHSAKEDPLLAELAAETRDRMQFPQMLTGIIEGQFLRTLVTISGAKRVLEIGMFTGYSALSMAAGLPADGRLITCEIDPDSIAMAKRYFARSPHGKKIEAREGPALETLASLSGPFDLVFIDADKESYPRYYEKSLELLRPGGLIVLDNALWSGRILDPADEETRAIARVNGMIAADKRVENVLLTVRDGINLVRKL